MLGTMASYDAEYDRTKPSVMDSRFANAETTVT